MAIRVFDVYEVTVIADGYPTFSALYADDETARNEAIRLVDIRAKGLGFNKKQINRAHVDLKHGFRFVNLYSENGEADIRIIIEEKAVNK